MKGAVELVKSFHMWMESTQMEDRRQGDKKKENINYAGRL